MLPILRQDSPTPEMLDAGAAILVGNLEGEDVRELAKLVFEAMLLARSSNDAGKGYADKAATSFGEQIRADRLNIAGVCTLQNFAAEFYSRRVSQS